MSDARPLRLGVAELLAHPGELRRREVTVTFGDLTLSTVAVEADQPVDLEVVLEGVPGGVTATGTVTSRWVGECRRCVTPVAGTLDAPFREVFAAEGDDPDLLPLDGDFVDLEPVVRELVLLALPLSPLCADDCRGPDPDHFPTDAVERREAEGEPSGDPRWAALDGLSFDGDA